MIAYAAQSRVRAQGWGAGSGDSENKAEVAWLEVYINTEADQHSDKGAIDVKE